MLYVCPKRSKGSLAEMGKCASCQVCEISFESGRRKEMG